MGYPVSASAIQAFQENRQTVTIQVTPVDGETFDITSADIRQNGFTLVRSTTSGKNIEVGSTIAGELQLTLDNTDGRFNSMVFAGAELFCTVSCQQDNTTYTIPLGFFTIDEAPKIRQIIKLNALDRMVQFDKQIDAARFSFPLTISGLLEEICLICNVPVSSTVDFSLFANSDLTVDEPTGSGQTYRQWVNWICQIMGVCAYIDWDGELRLEWYHTDESDENRGLLNGAVRFSSEYEEQDITLTGVSADCNGSWYLSGTEGYTLDISANEFLPEDPTGVLDAIYGEIAFFSYHTFSAESLPMPWLWPLDKIWFYYPGSQSDGFTSYVTKLTYRLNQKMAIRADGETRTLKGYAAANPLTVREQAVIQALEHQQSVEMDAKTQNVLQFNSLISNALGLYSTTVPQAGGGNIYYLHDQPELADSNFIATGTSNGIAWTNGGWNDGSPVWQYGVTAAGAAFFNILAADRVDANWIRTGVLQSTDGTTFYLDLNQGILNMDVTSLKLEGQDMSVIIQGVADDAAQAAQDVQDDLDDLKAHIVIGSDGSMTFIGASGNPITLKLTNDSVQILNGGTVIDTFGSGGTTTENLTIATNGSFNMPPFKWIVRSNQHLQLVYVG